MTSVRVSVDGGEMPADLHLPTGDRGPGIVLFQEIFGVTDYIDGRARDLAALGYVVLVPHLYWRQGDPTISGDGLSISIRKRTMPTLSLPESDGGS